MKIGITGSLHWDDKKKVKDIIFKLKSVYKDDLTIISRGHTYGADLFAKKYCMEFGINYQECPLYHLSWNQHCIDHHIKYNRPYRITNYFSQNKRYIEYCDKIIIFSMPQDSEVTSIEDLIKRILKADREYLLIK